MWQKTTTNNTQCNPCYTLYTLRTFDKAQLKRHNLINRPALHSPASREPPHQTNQSVWRRSFVIKVETFQPAIRTKQKLCRLEEISESESYSKYPRTMSLLKNSIYIFHLFITCLQSTEHLFSSRSYISLRSALMLYLHAGVSVTHIYTQLCSLLECCLCVCAPVFRLKFLFSVVLRLRTIGV